jgi:hypothetical protein
MPTSLLVRPKGWTPERTHSGGCEAQAWRDCPTCWRQGRIYEAAGDGWIVEVCPTCIGVGSIKAKEPMRIYRLRRD